MMSVGCQEQRRSRSLSHPSCGLEISFRSNWSWEQDTDWCRLAISSISQVIPRRLPWSRSQLHPQPFQSWRREHEISGPDSHLLEIAFCNLHAANRMYLLHCKDQQQNANGRPVSSFQNWRNASARRRNERKSKEKRIRFNLLFEYFIFVFPFIEIMNEWMNYLILANISAVSGISRSCQLTKNGTKMCPL